MYFDPFELIEIFFDNPVACIIGLVVLIVFLRVTTVVLL